jgi:hypothetical protein
LDFGLIIYKTPLFRQKGFHFHFPKPPILTPKSIQNPFSFSMADEPPPTSVDATIDSTGGTMSTCNTNNIIETSGVTSDDDKAKSLEYAEELMEKGYKASKEDDYAEAADCYSRALEIR